MERTNKSAVLSTTDEAEIGGYKVTFIYNTQSGNDIVKDVSFRGDFINPPANQAPGLKNFFGQMSARSKSITFSDPVNDTVIEDAVFNECRVILGL